MRASTKYRIFAAVAFSISIGFAYVIAAYAQAVTTPPVVAMACAYNTTPPNGTDKTFQLVQCGPSGGFVVAPIRGNPTDVSSTITSTGVYQPVMAANASRNNCTIQNNGSNNMSVRVNSTTVFILTPGQPLTCSSGNTVVISLIEITGTAGDTFAANYL